MYHNILKIRQSKSGTAVVSSEVRPCTSSQHLCLGTSIPEYPQLLITLYPTITFCILGYSIVYAQTWYCNVTGYKTILFCMSSGFSKQGSQYPLLFDIKRPVWWFQGSEWKIRGRNVWWWWSRNTLIHEWTACTILTYIVLYYFHRPKSQKGIQLSNGWRTGTTKSAVHWWCTTQQSLETLEVGLMDTLNIVTCVHTDCMPNIWKIEQQCNLCL